jgi:RNA polymerase sigma-70 factor (ECF subfamily)
MTELTAAGEQDVKNRTPQDLEPLLEEHRAALTAHCYRMLGSAFEADDAVQETLLRAWRSFGDFEGRSAVRSWLYRIATNVCLDMLGGRDRRARPMDLGPAQAAEASNLGDPLPEVTWIEPIPDAKVVGGGGGGDPAEVAEARETVKLAFVAALQHLPPRQRAVLILREVLRWKADEVGELLDMSVASVNSALQRARATIGPGAPEPSVEIDDQQQALLERYVDAFQRYDMESLTSLLHEDATWNMPPYSLWLQTHEDIVKWCLGPGIGCDGSRLVPIMANGSPAFAQYKPDLENGGYSAWSLQVLELSGEKISGITFFLDTERFYPMFGLPLRLDG